MGQYFIDIQYMKWVTIYWTHMWYSYLFYSKLRKIQIQSERETWGNKRLLGGKYGPAIKQ